LSNPNAFCEAEGSSTPAVCTYPQEINLFLGVIGFPAAENTAAFGAALADEYPLANFPDPFLSGDAPSSDEALAQSSNLGSLLPWEMNMKGTVECTRCHAHMESGWVADYTHGGIQRRIALFASSLHIIPHNCC
jgi:hypothetical protein